MHWLLQLQPDGAPGVAGDERALVLHHQQAFGVWRGESFDPVKALLQRFGGDGFYQIIERTVGQAMLAFAFERNDLHGNVSRERVQLEVVQHRPPEHVGQEDIQRDGGGAKLSGKLKRLFGLCINGPLFYPRGSPSKNDSRNDDGE